MGKSTRSSLYLLGNFQQCQDRLENHNEVCFSSPLCLTCSGECRDQEFLLEIHKELLCQVERQEIKTEKFQE